MTNDNAFAAFVAAKSEFDALIAKLQVLSADHFNTTPEAVHWGDVGSVGYAVEKLTDIAEHFTLTAAA
jgi:hypothetical protein